MPSPYLVTALLRLALLLPPRVLHREYSWRAWRAGGSGVGGGYADERRHVMDVLAAHLVGDILFQNRWLARVKKQSVVGMFLHCAITALVLALYLGWWDYRAMLAFGIHFLIDWFGLGKRVWPAVIKQGNPDDPDTTVPLWLSLLDDQALHIASLAAIARLPG